MSLSRFQPNMLLLICLFMIPGMASAVGLGKLTVGSYLGQPFKAEVELVSVKESDIPTLTAKLASPEAFRQAGLKYLDYHAGLSVTVARRVDGRPYLQIVSAQSMNEPFINLLIELNSAAGRLLREYTVLLDPVEMQLAPQTPVAQNDVARTGTDESVKTPARGTPNAAPVVPGSRRSSAVDWNEASYGPVEPGDNLTRIARQITPDGVDLNQMLVALYRANRDAFIEKNMNLLRVGAILRIPGQQEVASISPKEAAREVRTQTVDWQSYRQRVADMASGIVGSQSQQSVSGKISTVADEIVSAKDSTPQEVLRLSKGELLQGGQPTNSGIAAGTSQQQYLQMLEEDAIAKERALREANERVAQLEENVNRLQRLLKLKGEDLDSLQSQSDQLPEPLSTAVDPATMSSSAETPSTPAIAHTGQQQKLAENSIVPEFTIPAQAITNPAPAAIFEPEPAETDEFAWLDPILDFVTENMMMVGGALAALLAGWLGISMYRHRQEQAEIDAYDDIANYEAIVPESDSGAASTQTEGMVSQTSLDRETKENAEEPSSVSAFFFGKKLDESPLTQEIATNGSIQPGSEEPIVLSGAQDEIKIGVDSDEKTGNSAQLVDIMANDAFDEWRFPGSETRRVEEHVDKNSVGENASTDESVPSRNDEHEFDFALDYTSEAKQTGPESVNFDEKFAQIDLNLESEPAETAPLSGSVIDTDNDRWQEVATKIDLAKAYLEMEDREGAREILQEVLQEGDAEQQATARAMLSEIDG